MIIEDDGNRSKESTQKNQKIENTSEDNTLKLEMGGSKVHSTKIGCNTSIHILDTNPKAPCVVEKTISLRNFVREKSIIAVSIMLRHLSEKRYKGVVGNSSNVGKDASYSSKDNEMKEVYEKTMEKTTWNPLNYIKIASNVDAENKIILTDEHITKGSPLPIAMKGMIIVYTSLGCQ